MKDQYIIYVDASADMPADFMKKENIKMIPMSYTLGEEERICDSIQPVDIMKRFYDGQRKGDLTRTTQISPQKYMEIFEPHAKNGEKILYLCLSSGLSSTYSSSLMAADELNSAYPDFKLVSVDTLAATGGMGFICEMAAKNRAEGMSLEDNAAWIEANRLRVAHWFVVEDLQYLKRGGRVSAATAAMGSALNIKPILTIEANGTLNTFAKKRGSRQALKELVGLFEHSRKNTKGEMVYVIHADNDEGADFLESHIKDINPEVDIRRVMLSPIIGAHTGPGMCAIVYLSDPEFSRKPL